MICELLVAYGETTASKGWLQQRHPGQFTLGNKLTALINKHPAAIELQSSSLRHCFGHSDTAK
jgi:hypothetical protein